MIYTGNDRACRGGARAAIPLGLAALPFGLVYGVAVTESGATDWFGVAAS